MAEAEIRTGDVPCCPICFKQFNRPRQLPCVHSFCEKCLQSHITETTKDTNLNCVRCPVCDISTSYTIKDIPTNEWASSFPANTILVSVKDQLCEICKSLGISGPAEGYCLQCQETLGQDWLRVQKKLKTSTNPTISSMEELFCNPENVAKFAEGLTCIGHDGREMKYYCRDHGVICCYICISQFHNSCAIVLIKDYVSMLPESKPCDMILCIELIENHLKSCMEMNISDVKCLEFQNKKMNIDIKETRKKINAVLDKLEEKLVTKANTTYSKEIDKKLDDNRKSSSLIQAVRNFQYLLKAVDKHGSSFHKFLTVETIRSNLHLYHNQMREKYMKYNAVAIELKLSSPIQSIFSESLSEMGNIVITERSNYQTPKIYCLLEKPCATKPYIPRQAYQPNYTGATFIPGGRLMLADFNNNRCILLNSSYQFITSHDLTGNPWDVCALEDLEVAVSFGNKTEILILSVMYDDIKPVRMITTSFCCNGIASSGKREFVMSSFISGHTSCWSMYMDGNEKIYYHYDSSIYNYIALNNAITHVYIAINEINSLLCFDMYGKKLFTYSSDLLVSPRGVAVDRYDNIYVVGCQSCNIHQLSPLGSILQITNVEIKAPCAICIDHSNDLLLITNSCKRRAFHIYQLKPYLTGH